MPERRSGRPRRGRGSRRRTPTAASVRCRSVSAFVPKRLIVTWNGSGRPSSRSAIASPSSTSADTSSPCTTSTISEARSVMSARLRVKIRTSSPARCTWIRAPSSFHSTLARPNRSSAADTSSAVWASIGVIGCSGVSRKPPSPSTPSRIAAAATLGRSPASIAARRTAAAGTPAAFATASAITPSSAPCRSSPRNSPTSRRRSGSVARERRPSSSLRRAACEPGPAIDCRRDTAASTSSSSSVGDSAGGGRSRSAAHPTPTVPCGSAPDRYATAIATSSALASARQSASRATFPRRAGVAATSSDACAISPRSMADIQACHSHVRLIERA